jgi:hypothetical protein
MTSAERAASRTFEAECAASRTFAQPTAREAADSGS